MKPWIILATATHSIGANKLRTGLTLLGIVIGVAAVISLMAIGRGSQSAITSTIEGLGTNLVTVQPGSAATSVTFAFGGEGDDAPELTVEDANALLDPVFAPSVLAVAPEISTFATIQAGAEDTKAQVVGVTPEYVTVRNTPVETGWFVSPGDVISATDVVVLGSALAADLFGEQDPVGATVRMNSREFTVIGVLEERGGLSFISPDGRAYIPITTAYYRLTFGRTSAGDISVNAIGVSVIDEDAVDSAVEEISTVLRLRHRIDGEDDFTVSAQQDILDTLQETNNTFVVFLGAIAGISLLVGGIGVMNIMLVSVTERTREIGIRKALGAKRRDILLQFVSEATILSVGGGAVGVGVGALIIRLADGRNLLGSDLSTSFATDIALLALVVSAGIGLFFGIYPAVRAAALHPIEALRKE
jgi:putative ABC transport system permease protein